MVAYLEEAPLAAAPGTSLMLLDPTYFEQLVKAILLGITGAIGLNSRETTHTLVHWVKNMNDMGCLLLLEDEDAEVAGQWLQKIEESLTQILVPEEMRVNYMAQLLVESAQAWWTTMRNRRARERLVWVGFCREFEVKYYS